MPVPQIDGKLSSGMVKMAGHGSFILGMISDEDTSKISPVGLEAYFGHYPSGASFRNLTHFRQNIQTGKFAKFDFGQEVNLKKYNQITPPEYDLSKIKEVPIALFCGIKDRLASKEDYQWTRDQLGSNVVFYKEYDLGHLGLMCPADKGHI